MARTCLANNVPQLIVADIGACPNGKFVTERADHDGHLTPIVSKLPCSGQIFPAIVGIAAANRRGKLMATIVSI